MLDAAAGLAVRTGAPEADDLVERLAALAGRSGLRELIVRAHAHGGDIETARVLAEDIDNPALTRFLTRTRV